MPAAGVDVRAGVEEDRHGLEHLAVVLEPELRQDVKGTHAASATAAAAIGVMNGFRITHAIRASGGATWSSMAIHRDSGPAASYD